MKTVYSNLHAMRAIVCIAHERENTVFPYKIAVTLRYLYSLFLSQCLCLYLRASNERPYGIVQTAAILRSGDIVVNIKQLSSRTKNHSADLMITVDCGGTEILPSLSSVCFELLSGIRSARRVAFLIISSVIVSSLASFLLKL